MALQNRIELEAVLTRVILKLDKSIAERRSWPSLEDARRTFDLVRAASKEGPKLKALRQKLAGATEAVLSEIPNDGELHEDLWDIEDYIDYRA